MTSNSDACSLLPHMIDEIGALRGAGLARLRALRREYSRRLRDAGSRSILRLAYELKNSGVVHRFFSDELIANHKGAMECLTRRDLEQIGAGMDSWDQVDSFATIVAGPAWRAGRIGDADVAKWAHSCDRWWPTSVARVHDEAKRPRNEWRRTPYAGDLQNALGRS